MMKVISGVQPSGKIHLGNYYGAIKQHIELQSKHECTYFIADYHALTTQKDRKSLRNNVNELILDYCALGLTDKTTFYCQSDIPEVAELMWILNCVTPVGLMQRAPAYKEKVDKGLSANMGLFSYPVLMAADILANDADIVPVGSDQLAHLDICRDIAGSFNTTFRNCFKLPEAILSMTPKVPGTNGDKMSKSYGNTIDVFAPEASLKQQIFSVMTDSRQPGTPGKWLAEPATQLLDVMLTSAERPYWIKAIEEQGVGYKAVKDRILGIHLETFKDASIFREELVLRHKNKPIYDLLQTNRARENIRQKLAEVRTAVGLSF